MKTAGFLLIGVMVVSACGGGDRVARNYGGARVDFASGPISSACLRGGRKAANRQLCGCIQSVADRDLSTGDQRLAASFFRDPHKAQEIRQSDSASHEAFWKRYKAFAARSETICRGY